MDSSLLLCSKIIQNEQILHGHPGQCLFQSSNNKQSQSYVESQNSWMDIYLNAKVFQHEHEIQPLASSTDLQQHVQTPTNRKKQPQVCIRTKTLKNKSIFHNFQKHLISLLKRLVTIKRVEILNRPSGLRAYQLWKIFKMAKNYTKKVLYMVFGISSNTEGTNLKELCSSLPGVKRILDRHPIQQIEAAQELLRNTIFYQLSSLSKESFIGHCKMSKSDQFYLYYINFLQQLSLDGLSIRMTKQQKHKILIDDLAQN